MSVVTAALLLRIQLDEGIDSHNGNTRLHRRLQLLDLAHAGFQYTGLERVVYFAVSKIQAVVLVVLGLGKVLGVLRRGVCWVHGTLRESVSRSQVGDKLSSVLGCIDGKRLGDG